jgi:hypothetical protein
LQAKRSGFRRHHYNLLWGCLRRNTWDAATLADRVFEALIANDYGQYDELIRVLAPALGQPGLERLKHRTIDLSNRPATKPAEKDRVTVA